MSSSSSKSLNPHAPEYKPISPGISPNPLHYFSLLQNAAVSSPPPPPPPNRTTSYYFSRQQNTNAVNRFDYGQQRRGFRAGGRGRGLLRNERHKNIMINVCNNKNVGLMRKQVKREVMPLKRDEEKTTVMIKNIPYHCPRNQLMNMLDRFCMMENAKEMNEGSSKRVNEECAYDFLYLPIDFRTKRSRGFAFVNFTNTKTVWKFFNAFHLTDWDFVERNNSPKKIEIVCAKIQGKEALVKHFAGSMFVCETDEYLPVRFDPARDGSGQPVEVTVVGKRRAISHGGSTRSGSNHKTPRPRLFR